MKAKLDKIAVLEHFSGLLLAVAVIFSFTEIVLREGFGISYDFMVDLSVWFTIWALLPLLGPILLQGGHVSVDFIRDKLQGKTRWYLEVFNAVCTLVYGTVITVGGVIFVYKLYTRNVVFPRFFRIPQWIIEISVPIGVFIFTISAGIMLIRLMRRKVKAANH